MICSLSELRDKEVINVIDGRRMGFVTDVEIDVSCGKVIKLVLPPQNRYFCFFSSKEAILIPWDNIERIGNDTILVRFFEIEKECKRNDCCS